MTEDVVLQIAPVLELMLIPAFTLACAVVALIAGLATKGSSEWLH